MVLYHPRFGRSDVAFLGEYTVEPPHDAESALEPIFHCHANTRYNQVFTIEYSVRPDATMST